jgi:hypothetical protein
MTVASVKTSPTPATRRPISILRSIVPSIMPVVKTSTVKGHILVTMTKSRSAPAQAPISKPGDSLSRISGPRLVLTLGALGVLFGDIGCIHR